MSTEKYQEYRENMDFEKAKDRLEGVVRKTNMIYSDILSRETGNSVYIKPENLQRTGSFKIRGAYNKIAKLSKEDRDKGLIASSAGNHAQGVAYAAGKLGAKAIIVMPIGTPLIKIQATKEFGAEVILHGDCYDEAYAEAKRLEKKNGYTFIHPFNDKDVIEGQGTIGKEILDELSDVDYILVPVGGGGLISGIALAVKDQNPDVKIIGVEPEGAKTLMSSLEKGRVNCLNYVKTIADGVAVKEAGDFTFDIIRDTVDDIISVSDFEIMEAFLVLLDRHKLVGENAGVLSLAGAKKLGFKGKKVVSIVSGGNIDVLTMSTMINRGLISRGRIFSFSLDLQDTPGQLLKVSEILAEEGANVIKLDHNQLKSIDRFKEVELEITVETNGLDHVESIKRAFKRADYTINEN